MTLLETFASIASPQELLHSRFISEEDRQWRADVCTMLSIRKRTAVPKTKRRASMARSPFGEA